MRQIPLSIVRGGTSRGLFFRATDLPTAQAERDAIFLRCMGSPDPYRNQIDGLGGATSSTSKVMVVEQAQLTGDNEVQIPFTFGQVSIDRAQVDYKATCGNLSAAVPIFALSEGLIDENRSGSRIFKLFCRNTKKLIEATVDFEKKDTHIDGIAFGSGTSVLLSFLRPGGSVTGNIFPTTLRQEVLGERYPATLIDCANAAVFLHCKHFALRGDEPRNELNSNVKLLQTLEELRAEAAVRMHIASSIAEAKTKRLSTPKICLITEPINYKDVRQREILATDIAVLCRYVSMGQFHHAIPATGAIAVASAACIPGTVVNEVTAQYLLNKFNGSSVQKSIVVAHAAGTIQCTTTIDQNGFDIEKAGFLRTARILMSGRCNIN